MAKKLKKLEEQGGQLLGRQNEKNVNFTWNVFGCNKSFANFIGQKMTESVQNLDLITPKHQKSKELKG